MAAAGPPRDDAHAPYVVAATRLELNGRVLLDVPEPYTGKVG
ncbi:hypothetical protein [Streptomyces sp. NPDC059744]